MRAFVVLDLVVLYKLALALHGLKIGIECIVVDVGVDITGLCTECTARITVRRSNRWLDYAYCSITIVRAYTASRRRTWNPLFWCTNILCSHNKNGRCESPELLVLYNFTQQKDWTIRILHYRIVHQQEQSNVEYDKNVNGLIANYLHCTSSVLPKRRMKKERKAENTRVKVIEWLIINGFLFRRVPHYGVWRQRDGQWGLCGVILNVQFVLTK